MRSQVLRPPYVYRWAVLIAAVVILGALVLRAFQPDPDVADTAHVARAAPAKTTSAPRPVSPDVISQVAGGEANGEKIVALTFDDGPHPEHTPAILGVLAENHAVATFCMVGKQVVAHPDLVRDVVDAGMRLCNHTVHHEETLSRKPVAAIETELTGASDDLRSAAGDDVAIEYFRAPGGNWSAPLTRTAARHGMHPLGWSVDPRDWARPGVRAIVASVERNVRPGAVVLLHDGGGHREQTVAALRQVLPWLAAQGYRFGFPA